MISYSNLECIVCDKKFVDNDDIVVCPECGTPHHRGCYNDKGHCSNTTLHEKGEIFKNPNRDNTDLYIKCSKCEALNVKSSVECKVCGNNLHHNTDPVATSSDESVINDIYNTFSREDVKGESLSDLNNFIGENSIYYISKMKLNPDKSNFVSWNWSACLFSYSYFFYRKMFFAGFAFLSLFILSFIPTLFLANELIKQALVNPSLITTMNFNLIGLEKIIRLCRFTSNIPFLISIICGLKANSIYCSHVLNRLYYIRKKTTDKTNFDKKIKSIGGISLPYGIFSVIGFMSIYFLSVWIMTFMV